MAVIQVEVDDQLLRGAQAVAASSCMDLAQVIQFLFEQMVHDQKLPFLPLDPFYRPENLAELKRRIEDMKRHPEKLKAHDLIQ